ncbi:GntR family transcriptional regulator [Portibacter lacus]|uniref:HTH gntR-type domain-containing protein n=1 Tax=Portibacter lacus TaxID=1099794 RepID=A0AA37SQG4_9BACT|nr:GntR family transcriptional regulator [Portibacter lacus]GLR15755.1 hypothetical protein GCM10007940_03700 [Portibacter lacus]
MIKKITFRDEVKKELLKAMFKGDLIPGQRVSLPSISKKLEVSVTPVREALTQLSESGIVSYIPNRGFIVTELNEEEAIELYEAISILESSALLLSTYSSEDLQKLEHCQNAFSTAKTKGTRVKRDMAFHQQLIAPFSNSLIKKMIDDLRVRLFFYELEYMAYDELNIASNAGHEKILLELKRGDLQSAAHGLKENWTISINNITSQMNIQE